MLRLPTFVSTPKPQLLSPTCHLQSLLCLQFPIRFDTALGTLPLMALRRRSAAGTGIGMFHLFVLVGVAVFLRPLVVFAFSLLSL